MTNEEIAAKLGTVLFQAARASVAQGAIFQPGEMIQTNAEDAWKQVAEVLVKLAENIGAKGDESKGVDSRA